MKRLVALVIFLLINGCAIAAQPLPTPNGYVTDQANMLSSTVESELNQALSELEKTDSTQIAVLTINTLNNEALESYALNILQTWGIGQKQKDNGALLLIVKNDRKIRIEVGYGLEGRLTDLLSGRIIDHIISPKFKQGQFDEGVSAGVHAMIDVVHGEFKAEKKTKTKIHPLIIMIGFFVFSLIVSRLNRKYGSKTRRSSMRFPTSSHRGGYGGSSHSGSSGGGFSGGGGSGGGGGASGGW